MLTVLCRFDDAEAFPPLDSRTTVRGPVVTRVRGKGEEKELVLAFRRHSSDPADAEAVLALPFIAIDGRPERLGLTLRGDGSGARPFVEGDDVEGRGLIYRFEPVRSAGLVTCWIEVQAPTEQFDADQVVEDRSAVVPPVRLYRFGVAPGCTAEGVAIGLRKLIVTGEVRLSSPGIA